MDKTQELKQNKTLTDQQAEKTDGQPATRPRLLKGTVLNDAKDKTVKVLVNRYKLHPKYRKRYKVSKKYLAHDEENKLTKGDLVTIKEVRPISKRKKWLALKSQK